MQEVLTSDFRARIFHPEDLQRVREDKEGGLAGGLPFEIEQRVLRKDGRYHWLLLRYKPFHDEHGRLVRWYATGTDIDDRRRAEDRTKNENIALREDVDHSSMFEEIVGSSPSLRKVLKVVDKVAATDSTVLILGETGTGKELIARAIHKRSRRSNRAFIRVNCAAIPQALIASELFGHEKGAFTGAVERRVGRFETADGESWFGRDSKPGGSELLPLSTTLTKNERDIIEKALSESAGQVGGANGAAARLGIPRETLDSKIKLLGINKFHYKKP